MQRMGTRAQSPEPRKSSEEDEKKEGEQAATKV